jgi:hypothetical protein
MAPSQVFATAPGTSIDITPRTGVTTTSNGKIIYSLKVPLAMN